MFIILGTTKSGKTTFIRQHILRSSKNFVSKDTLDLKAYAFKGDYIIDTPCITVYRDLADVMDKCNKMVAGSNKMHLIYFITQDFNASAIIKTVNEAKTIGAEIVFFDPLSSWNISNIKIQIIKSDTELYRHIASNVSIVPNKQKQILMVGITNTGKTSIINSLVKDEVFRTAATKHTTQETLKVSFGYNNTSVEIYDTYGLEKSSRQDLLHLEKLIKYVDRVIIVMDKFTYEQQAYNFIFNRLEKLYTNITFLINKSDLLISNDKSKISNFLKEKYKIPAKDLVYNNTINPNTTKNNIIRIAEQQKPIFNHHKINKEIKPLFPNILYLNEHQDAEQNKIYKIDVYMKKRDITLTLGPMLKRLKNTIYKCLGTRSYAIVFAIHYKYDKPHYANSKPKQFTRNNN